MRFYMKSNELVQSLIELYGEHLEMTDHPETMLIEILANKLIQQTELAEHYKERLKHYEIEHYPGYRRLACTQSGKNRS